MTDFDLSQDEVYYGQEANLYFMSVSQFKSFRFCEAQTMAKLKGEWTPEKDSVALLVGNYVHSYFESKEAHEKFRQDNAHEIAKNPSKTELQAGLDELGIEYKQGDSIAVLESLYGDNPLPIGEPYAQFKVAEDMIHRLEDWELFNYLYQGEKEVPIEGMLYGCEWKGKIDCLNVDKGYFVDIKTTADINKRMWSDRYGMHVSFPLAYGYDIQIYVYQKLLEKKYGKPFEGYIAAVSKQDPPAVQMIYFDDNDLQVAEQEIVDNIDRVLEVKEGEVKPSHCGKCDYCRGHVNPVGFTNARDLV